MAEDRVGPVGRFEPGHLVAGQGHFDRCYRVLEVSKLGRSHDRGRDRRLGEQPRQRDLGRREASFAGDRTQRVDDVEVRLAVQLAGERVVAGADRPGFPVTCAGPGEQATPRQMRETFKPDRPRFTYRMALSGRGAFAW